MDEYSFTIDLSLLRKCEDIYPLIINSLELPKYCGHNKDALWDFLTDYMGSHVEIIIKGLSSLSKTCQKQIADILAVIKEAEETYPDYFHLNFMD